MKMVTGYKLARPDGWDFYTGKTINYRGDGHYPHIVRVPNGDAAKGICSSGVGHASEKPNDCFAGANIPCSAFRLSFVPVCGDETKYGWVEAEVLEEITDLDALLGWNYTEACNPIHPFSLPQRIPSDEDIELLKKWASVWASVGASVGASVWDSVGASVEASVRDSVRDSVGTSVWASVGASVAASVWASVGASVWAYFGSLFPGVKKWKGVSHEPGMYPFQPAVDLWKRGLVSSFDGKLWHLHSGPKAKVVYKGA